MREHYLYEEESEFVIGRVFEVRNSLGGGWSEEIYHQALMRNLSDHQIPAVSKPQSTLIHRGIEIQTFVPDIIVADKIILELKVLPDFKGNRFPSANQGQIIHYLKRFRKELGLLINFAHSKVGIKRMILDKEETAVLEDYSRIKEQLHGNARETLLQVRQLILQIAQQYGIGYPETTYRKIIGIELEALGIACINEITIPARWKGETVGHQQTQHLLVANRFLLLIRATLENPTTFDYIKTRSYLKALGLQIGLVINFGRTGLQIFGTAV